VVSLGTRLEMGGQLKNIRNSREGARTTRIMPVFETGTDTANETGLRIRKKNGRRQDQPPRSHPQHALSPFV